MGSASALCKIGEAECGAVLATGVRRTWLGVKHAIPHMLTMAGGFIVNLSSLHGLHGNRGRPLTRVKTQ